MHALKVANGKHGDIRFRLFSQEFVNFGLMTVVSTIFGVRLERAVLQMSLSIEMPLTTLDKK